MSNVNNVPSNFNTTDMQIGDEHDKRHCTVDQKLIEPSIHNITCVICGYKGEIPVENMDSGRRSDAIADACSFAGWTPRIHLNGQDMGSACPTCLKYLEENADGLYEVITSRIPPAHVGRLVRLYQIHTTISQCDMLLNCL